MFSGVDPRDGYRSHQAHLAEMVGYLGEPPLKFLQRSKCYREYFDDSDGVGKLIREQAACENPS